MMMIMIDDEEGKGRGEDEASGKEQDRLGGDCNCRVAQGGELVVLGWYDMRCVLLCRDQLARVR